MVGFKLRTCLESANFTRSLTVNPMSFSSTGKIGFAELAKTISQRWKKCTLEMKKHFESLALVEKRRYYDDLLVYRVKQLHTSVQNDQFNMNYPRKEDKSLRRCQQISSPVSSLPPSLIQSPCPSQHELGTDLEPLPISHVGDSSSLIDRGVCEFLLSAFANEK